MSNNHITQTIINNEFVRLATLESRNNNISSFVISSWKEEAERKIPADEYTGKELSLSLNDFSNKFIKPNMVSYRAEAIAQARNKLNNHYNPSEININADIAIIDKINQNATHCNNWQKFTKSNKRLR